MHDAALPTTDGNGATEPRVRDQLRPMLENDLRAEATRDRSREHDVATFGDGPGSVAMFGDGPPSVAMFGDGPPSVATFGDGTGLLSDAAILGDA